MGKPRAVIHYADANIIHAACDGIIGREAVFALVGFNSGRFEFFRGRAERIERTVHANVQNLILEGLRRLDELSHVTSLLPKASSLPTSSSTATTTPTSTPSSRANSSRAKSTRRATSSSNPATATAPRA